VNRSLHACTGENFCAGGVFYVPETENGYCRGWGACDRGIAQMAQFWAMGIISEASRHPKDVPFVREFCWDSTVCAL